MKYTVRIIEMLVRPEKKHADIVRQINEICQRYGYRYRKLSVFRNINRKTQHIKLELLKEIPTEKKFKGVVLDSNEIVWEPPSSKDSERKLQCLIGDLKKSEEQEDYEAAAKIRDMIYGMHESVDLKEILN